MFIPSICLPVQQCYIDSNHSMLSLAKLIIGALDDSCLPLHDIMAEPWNKFQKISQAILDALGTEIKCW